MKKILFVFLTVMLALPAFSQSCYWVFLTDKQGTTFDPYTYFDAKAIERYNQCGADLYDISNYPLNSSYVSQIDAIATEEVGTSRWLNAVAVMATPEQMSRIEQLPFVKGTHQIASEMQIAAYKALSEYSENSECSENSEFPANPETPLLLHEQLIRMGGLEFAKQGIDGKGVRIPSNHQNLELLQRQGGCLWLEQPRHHDPQLHCRHFLWHKEDGSRHRG